jgi:hypothetical protein
MRASKEEFWIYMQLDKETLPQGASNASFVQRAAKRSHNKRPAGEASAKPARTAKKDK